MRKLLLILFILSSCQSGPAVREDYEVNIEISPSLHSHNPADTTAYDSTYHIVFPNGLETSGSVQAVIPWDTTVFLPAGGMYYIEAFNRDTSCMVTFNISVEGDPLQPLSYGVDNEPCVISFSNVPGDHQPWPKF